MNPTATCARHPVSPVQWSCSVCGIPLCAQCRPVAWQRTIYCGPCMRQHEQSLATQQRVGAKRQQINSWLIAAGLLVAALGAGIGLYRMTTQWSSASLQRRYQASRPIAPNFLARDLQGAPLSLTQLRGRVVVLDFWASWCGPCRQVMPDLRQLAARLQERPMSLIGISLDDDRAAAEAAVTKFQMTWPQVWDGEAWESPIVASYGVTALPTTVLIDKRGHIFHTGHLPISTLTRLIEFLLDQP